MRSRGGGGGDVISKPAFFFRAVFRNSWRGRAWGVENYSMPFRRLRAELNSRAPKGPDSGLCAERGGGGVGQWPVVSGPVLACTPSFQKKKNPPI